METLIWDLPERTDSFHWTETDMKLFDGRYWVRLRYRQFNLSPGHRIRLRFLEPGDIDRIRIDESGTLTWKTLQQTLKEKAPGKLRYTLPAIVQTHFVKTADGQREMKSKLLALPTLHWSSAGWVEYDKQNFQEAWMWTIRFRKVDFDHSTRHTFVA